MDLKEKINSFPKTPGIYMMKDKDGNIIYVGKSKKLQERIRSYFVNSKSHSRKVQRMVKNIYDIEIKTTDTELDALLLECEMIKKIRPIYNKLMKNHENYSYFKIDKNIDYPYIQVVDEIDDDNLYFGPYTIGRKLENIKEIIEKAYKTRSCKRMTKCFKYDLGKCVGPCRDIISKDDYNNIINNIISDLNLETKNIVKILEDNMKSEINKLNFEKAANIKEDIDSVNILFNRQDIINNITKNESILAWINLDGNYKIYVIQNGKLIKSEIIKCIEFDNLDKEKYYKENKVKSEENKIIDKFDIDFINIIYSYIRYNKDIKYIVFK